MLAYTHITKTIAELLYKHDCVIVPGFGGYVARRHSAVFSKSQSTLLPPAKTILFNKNLMHNDGLLASAMMEQQALTFDAANKQLEDYVSYCQAMLRAKNRLELKHLGLFYMDAEQTLRFEPETDVNFLIESFGLAPLAVHELAIETVPESRMVFEDRRIATETIPQPKRKRNYTRMATLAVGIPVALALVLFAATSKPLKPVMESSFNPFYSPEKTYTPVKYVHAPLDMQTSEASPLLADANGYASFSLGNHVIVANISDTITRTDKTAVKPVKAVHLASNNSSAFDGKYQVVVGCFGVEANAERLVHELRSKNITAGISGVNAKGLHVVSCGGFQTKDDASAMLNSIRASYPNAWVMAK
ncbi:MAG: SPOR domain-containing protein [Bacteroidetes bacterium]|nr:SPOR domain-containing protein [Bacteroidota bacterium]